MPKSLLPNLYIHLLIARIHLGMKLCILKKNVILRPFAFCFLAFQDQFLPHRRHPHPQSPQSRFRC